MYDDGAATTTAVVLQLLLFIYFAFLLLLHYDGDISQARLLQTLSAHAVGAFTFIVHFVGFFLLCRYSHMKHLGGRYLLESYIGEI